MLFIVSTPIGNLGDISDRALTTLKEVDLVLSEDTRRTRKLLSHFDIKVPLESYHYHSDDKKKNRILDLLKEGKELALVSDAGTPGISDPGGKLIEFLVPKFFNLKVVPIPGPSAVTAALSVSGFATNKFTFLGFPPKKRGRRKYFKDVLDREEVVVFFESCHRIIKTLEELNTSRDMVVCQELTKLHETIYRGSLDGILEDLKRATIKGEFVVVIDKI